MAPQDQSRISVDSLLLNFLDNHPANDMAANRNALAAGMPSTQGADDDVQVVASRTVSSTTAPTPCTHAAPGNRAYGHSQAIMPPPAEAFAPATPFLPAPRAPLAQTDANRPVEAPVRPSPLHYPHPQANTVQTTRTKKPRAPRAHKTPPSYLDVSAISLPGEPTNSVPIHDTCHTVRLAIRAALRRPGITQAAFLRAISASYTDGRRVLSRGLNDFLAKKGVLAGNRNYAYYAAYVFFEKVRVRDGKAKSKDREVMERKWPSGVDTETDYSKGWFTMHERDRGVVVDKYGCIKVY